MNEYEKDLITVINISLYDTKIKTPADVPEEKLDMKMVIIGSKSYFIKDCEFSNLIISLDMTNESKLYFLNLYELLILY